MLFDDSTTKRFWAKVHKTDSCWLWTGSLSRGYATFSHGGRRYSVHRFAYELLVGPIPKGLVIDHLCRVRHCVNIDHLEVVTQRVNILRGVGAPANHARQTHCPKGHDKTVYGSNHGCRACNKVYIREWKRRWRQAKKEKECLLIDLNNR